MDSTKKFDNVDQYISEQDDSIIEKLNQIREIIKQTAPNASEVISYGMPAYRQYGVLVYFAANKNHIGFYPTASPIVVFAEELSDYKTSKGAIQFPIDKHLPVDLIKRIVEYRINEDELSYIQKKKKK